MEVFIIGFLLGFVVSNLSYIFYFQIFIINRIEGVITETRGWIDGHLKSDPTQKVSPLINMFNSFHVQKYI